MNHTDWNTNSGNVMTFSKLSTETKSPSTISDERLALMIWGSAGCGKTTLAATMPRPILYIQFDPGGHKSIINMEGVDRFDLSSEGCAITNNLMKENPLGIEQYIKEHGIKTVIVDSTTTLSDLCLENAIKIGVPGVRLHLDSGKPITREAPGLNGYGHRNAQMLEIVKQFLRSTVRTQAHIVFLAHEAAPEKDKNGVVLYITVMLGGTLPEFTGLNLDEVWFMNQDEKTYRICTRPARMRKPMKTRIFDMNSGIEWIWKFDPIKWEGMTLESIIDDYRKAGTKIPIPK
jgi:hypothetical protein